LWSLVEVVEDPMLVHTQVEEEVLVDIELELDFP
jgi:hypothetical protein